MASSSAFTAKVLLLLAILLPSPVWDNAVFDVTNPPPGCKNESSGLANGTAGLVKPRHINILCMILIHLESTIYPPRCTGGSWQISFPVAVGMAPPSIDGNFVASGIMKNTACGCSIFPIRQIRPPTLDTADRPWRNRRENGRSVRRGTCRRFDDLSKRTESCGHRRRPPRLPKISHSNKTTRTRSNRCGSISNGQNTKITLDVFESLSQKLPHWLAGPSAGDYSVDFNAPKPKPGQRRIFLSPDCGNVSQTRKMLLFAGNKLPTLAISGQMIGGSRRIQ